MRRVGIAIAALLVLVIAAVALAVVRDPLGLSIGYTRWRLVQAGFVHKTLDVQVPNGAFQISYFERHPQAPRAALLIHGLQDNAGSWFQVVGPLDDFHTLIMDLPGHGDSGPPTGPITTDHLRQGVLGVARQAGDKPLTVVGNSLGGYLALGFAIENPERVAHLVAVNAAGMPMRLDPTTFLPQSVDEMGQTMRKVLGPNEVQPPSFVLEEMLASIHDGPTPRLWDALLAAPTLENRLSEISARTDVIWGDADGLIPFQNGEAMARGIRGARFHRLSGCGHSPQITCPDQFLPIFSANLDQPQTP